MKINTMKMLDEVFGPLICFFLNLYNFMKGIFSGSSIPSDRMDVRHIVILKFFGMGSIILAGPLFRALKCHYPRAKIILFTFANNREIALRIREIDEVVTVETRNLIGFTISMQRALCYIRSRHCEISFDLEFFTKSSTIIQYLCRTKVRVGYYLMQTGYLIRIMWRGNLLTHNVYYNPHRHVSEAFLALGRSVGADTRDMRPAAISCTVVEDACLSKMLSNHNISEEDFLIVVNINASELCLERRWPREYFAELITKMLGHKHVKIILIGQREDQPYVDSLAEIVKEQQERLKNFTGKLDIGLLAALMKRANLFITNDSGPLHIAVSMGTPTVSFFGPEIPERFGHQGECHSSFYAGVYCSPCLNVFNQKTAPCNGNNVCMQQIDVDKVYAVIDDKFFKDPFTTKEC